MAICSRRSVVVKVWPSKNNLLRSLYDCLVTLICTMSLLLTTSIMYSLQYKLSIAEGTTRINARNFLFLFICFILNYTVSKFNLFYSSVSHYLVVHVFIYAKIKMLYFFNISINTSYLYNIASSRSYFKKVEI